MIDEIIKNSDGKMQKCIESLKTALSKLRTGRAHPSLLSHLMVDYYGNPTPLSQVANIAIDDPRTLSITPWEKTLIGPIEKAILTSDLGLNPATAGMVIRVPLPPLTEQRRQEMVKVVKENAEKAKVAIRNVRRDGNQGFKDLVKSKEASEDDERRAQDQMQKLTDQFIAKIDQILEEKSKDLLEF